MKVATAFSGGLAACEWALKYEELEHEVVLRVSGISTLENSISHFMESLQVIFMKIYKT